MRDCVGIVQQKCVRVRFRVHLRVRRHLRKHIAMSFSLLEEIPDEILSYIFNDTLLNSVFNNFPVISVLPHPLQQMSLSLRKIYQEKIPAPGQMLTLDKLVPSIDGVALPSYELYLKKVIDFFTSPSCAVLQKYVVLSHALPFIQKRIHLTASNRDEFWEQAKHMKLGRRHAFKYIAATNTLINTLRAVCKKFRGFFDDYIFRPFVEMDPFDENESEISGSPCLRNAPELGMNFANRTQTLHVYFARKSLFKNETTGKIHHRWQYLNPSVASVGCNSLRVTAETCKDDENQIIELPVVQYEPKTSIKIYNENRWQTWTDLPGHNVEPLANAVYSIHSGSTKSSNQSAKPSLTVLWDVKFPISEKVATSDAENGLDLAKTQSILLNVRCNKTSTSLAASSKAPLRCVRYRVSFGNMNEVHDFKPTLSGVSEFHYISNLSMKARAVTNRANKRKIRTETERLERNVA